MCGCLGFRWILSPGHTWPEAASDDGLAEHAAELQALHPSEQVLLQRGGLQPAKSPSGSPTHTNLFSSKPMCPNERVLLQRSGLAH